MQDAGGEVKAVGKRGLAGTHGHMKEEREDAGYCRFRYLYRLVYGDQDPALIH